MFGVLVEMKSDHDEEVLIRLLLEQRRDVECSARQPKYVVCGRVTKAGSRGRTNKVSTFA